MTEPTSLYRGKVKDYPGGLTGCPCGTCKVKLKQHDVIVVCGYASGTVKYSAAYHAKGCYDKARDNKARDNKPT